MEQIRLNLIPTGPMPVCHASQYDKKREIGLVLFNGTRPLLLTDETLELDVRKSDSHIVTIDVPTPEGKNLAVFETTEQMCAVAGSNECELRIKKAGANIGSLNFIMEIERSPMENGLASDSEIANLTTQMTAIAEPLVSEIAPPIVEELVPQVIGDDYYTKTQTDEAIATAVEGKADKTDTYTKTQVDTALNGKADKDTTYTKTQVDSEISRLDRRIDTKANASDVYTKSQTDNLLNDKADVTDLPDMSQYYDKSKVDDLLDDKANSDDVYDKAYIDTALSGKANVGTSYTKSEEDALLANKADKSDTYTKEQVDDIVYGILPDDTASGSVANFDTSLELPLKSLEVDVNAVQEAGTPTPATPLPISGWSEIKIVHTGKNLAIKENLNTTYFSMDNDGVFTQNNQSSAPFSWVYSNSIIKISLPAGTYTLTTFAKTISTNPNANVQVIDDSDQRIANNVTMNSKTKSFVSFTLSKNSNIGIVAKIYEGAFYFQLEVGSTATEYEAYNGNEYIINLGGTYYGGHLTQDKAGHRKFEVTHKRYLLENISESDLSLSLLSGYTQAGYLPYIAEGVINPDIISDKFETQSPSQTHSEYKVWGSISAPRLFFGFPTSVTTKSQVVQWFANNPTVVVAELATPIIIDLPDGEPITTFIGTNNIYADTGDTSVVFKDSVSGYVEKKIASVQALALNT